jgi:PAS domain S-box-containing protein
MAAEFQETGISVIGNVPWGTHFCYFYDTKQDLLDVLVPYFKTGLESNEFCLWIISDSELITTEEAKRALGEAVPDLDRYLAAGNIEVVSHSQWFLRGGPFDPDRVASQFKEKLDEALARGYAGMRVNGSPAWLSTKSEKDLHAFEAKLDGLFPDQQIIASCSYQLAGIKGVQVFDIVRSHQFAIARRQGEWEIIESPELKQAKQEIKKLNEVLEQRVIERTNELRVANVELRKEIDERKRAEALLHAKEQEFRAIVENAPDQIIRYDREFRRTYVNPAVTRVYGLSAQALTGKPIGSVILDAGLDIKEDELAQVRERIAAVFATGELLEYEMTWPTPTGRKHYGVRLFPELDLNGSVVNVLGIVRDITKRRNAEEELKKEKEILEKIFENIPVMIGFIGEDGRIKLVNPQWERTMGWTLKDLQDPAVDIFAEAYPDLKYRQEVLDFVTAATGEWVDLKIRVRDGRMIDAACAMVHLSGGTKVAIAQDITERKQAEERLKATTEQMRALSARVHAVKEEEGTRIARELHDELGATLSSLRWDLEAVDEAISELADQSELHGLRKKLKTMMRLIETTVNTVRRISSEMRPTALDDLGLMAAIEWQVRQFQNRTGIIVRCEWDIENPDLSRVQSVAVFRIFQEALTNILRHAQATNVHIQAKEEDGELILTINDNGRGITEDEKSGEHTLGLLGMRERAHLVGGRIEITGSIGEGTTVVVRIHPSGEKGS